AGSGNRSRLRILGGWCSTNYVSLHENSLTGLLSLPSVLGLKALSAQLINQEDQVGQVDQECQVDAFVLVVGGEGFEPPRAIKAGRSTVCCVQPGFATRPRIRPEAGGTRRPKSL